MVFKVVLVLFIILTTLSSFILSEIIDDCSQLYVPYSVLETVKASTINLIIDTNNENLFDGDKNRFKRPDDKDGVLLYESSLGIEGITLEGFVYKGTILDNWRLLVIMDNNQSNAYAYDKNNFNTIKIDYSSNNTTKEDDDNEGWEKYKIKIEDKNMCTKKIEIVMTGAATDNKDMGWGLQISNVIIKDSYFEG